MSDSSETIQEIAYKLMLEQNKNEKILNGPTERTIFVLGSKGVVSCWLQFIAKENCAIIIFLGQNDNDQ